MVRSMSSCDREHILGYTSVHIEDCSYRGLRSFVFLFPPVAQRRKLYMLRGSPFASDPDERRGNKASLEKLYHENVQKRKEESVTTKLIFHEGNRGTYKYKD